MFLDNFGVIGRHFTVVKLHADWDVIRLILIRIFITAFSHQFFQNLMEYTFDLAFLVFVDIGGNLPPVYLERQGTSLVNLCFACWHKNTIQKQRLMNVMQIFNEEVLMFYEIIIIYELCE